MKTSILLTFILNSIISNAWAQDKLKFLSLEKIEDKITNSTFAASSFPKFEDIVISRG